eukprot:9368259-Alexandrium_andersonii.AAC.1
MAAAGPDQACSLAHALAMLVPHQHRATKSKGRHREASPALQTRWGVRAGERAPSSLTHS